MRIQVRKARSQTKGLERKVRALCARKTLTTGFTDFFTDFEKKTDCFAVYFKYNILLNYILKHSHIEYIKPKYAPFNVSPLVFLFQTT